MGNRLLYISAHSVLEYDELKLFTELGYDCFSLGAYTNPEGHYQLPRPAIPGMRIRLDLIDLVKDMPRTELSWLFIDNFDIIVVMDGYHAVNVIKRNWNLIKNKRVVWRTIGQSLPEVEAAMSRFRKEGLRIIRYSEMEKELDNYAGHDKVIHFYKDPNEFCNWTGHVNQIINLSQSLKARRNFCGYDSILKMGEGFPLKVYGSGNEDLGEFHGGELSYEGMKGALRDCKVYLYGGTWPAPYTLGFIEAMMTGIPIVSVGRETWKHKDWASIKLFEVPSMMSRGDEGFWSDNIEECRQWINKFITDRELAQNVSARARAKAIQLFGKDKIKEQWRTFLESL